MSVLVGTVTISYHLGSDGTPYIDVETTEQIDQVTALGALALATYALSRGDA